MSEREWQMLALQANRIDLVVPDTTPTQAARAAINEIEFLRDYIVELLIDYNRLLRGEPSRGMRSLATRKQEPEYSI